MYTLLAGINPIQWRGDTVAIAAAPCAAVIRYVYTRNPVTGISFITYEAGDPFSQLQSFTAGVDYLVVATGTCLIAADAGPATSGAFDDFAGYTPAELSTAPTIPIGRTETGVAAEPIIGGRLVAQTAKGLRHYSSDILEHEHLLFGIALNGALAGGSVSVRRPGFVNYDGWGLPPDTVLLAGPDGRLVTQVPATSFHHVIGRSLDSDTLIYQPESLIFLSNPQVIS